jgi:tRNA (guanosine-2'-O-)-methyltransferase
MEEKILERLLDMVSDNKRELIHQISAQRTRHITVVVENIYQSHNASAVVRSCDCFGIQDVHVISTYNPYKVNREVAMGSGKWVDTHNYTGKNTTDCLLELKSKGYRIVATMPHHHDQKINELDVSQPIALVFGTEEHGLSDEAIALADDFVRIPMYGFAESFNISVSAALSLQVLREKLMNSDIAWQLSDKELTQLKIEWCKTVIREGEKVYLKVVEDIKKEANVGL